MDSSVTGPVLPRVAQINRYRPVPVRPADLRRLHRLICYCLAMTALNLILSLCILFR
jgi:hypothetical protein